MDGWKDGYHSLNIDKMGKVLTQASAQYFPQKATYTFPNPSS